MTIAGHHVWTLIGYNGSQPNDTQHNNLICNTQHYNTFSITMNKKAELSIMDLVHNVVMPSVTNKPLLLSVIMLSVVAQFKSRLHCKTI